jgi:hypothetical protein
VSRPNEAIARVGVVGLQIGKNRFIFVCAGAAHDVSIQIRLSVVRQEWAIRVVALLSPCVAYSDSNRWGHVIYCRVRNVSIEF